MLQHAAHPSPARSRMAGGACRWRVRGTQDTTQGPDSMTLTTAATTPLEYTCASRAASAHMLGTRRCAWHTQTHTDPCQRCSLCKASPCTTHRYLWSAPRSLPKCQAMQALPLHAACHRINQRTVAVMCLCRLPVASSQWHSGYICSTTLHVPVRTNRPCTRHTCMTSGQHAYASHDNRQQERALQPHTTTRLLQTLCPA
jgi:hypothetical protein